MLRFRYSFGIVVIILSFACSINALAQEQNPLINKTPAKEETSKANKTKENTQEKINSASHPKSEEVSKKTRKVQNSFWQKFWGFSFTDSLLAIFTFILAIIGYFQYKILQNTLLKSRAFIFLKEIKFEPVMIRQGLEGYKEGQKWLLSPCWENSGDTPTKNLTISINSKVFNSEIPDDWGFPYSKIKDIPMVIGPKAEIVVGAFPVPYINIIEPLQGSQITNLYIWGEAKYNDIFSKNIHHTRFCIKMLFLKQQIVGEYDTPTFIYYDRYNYAD